MPVRRWLPPLELPDRRRRRRAWHLAVHPHRRGAGCAVRYPSADSSSRITGDPAPAPERSKPARPRDPPRRPLRTEVLRPVPSLPRTAPAPTRRGDSGPAGLTAARKQRPSMSPAARHTASGPLLDRVAWMRRPRAPEGGADGPGTPVVSGAPLRPRCPLHSPPAVPRSPLEALGCIAPHEDGVPGFTPVRPQRGRASRRSACHAAGLHDDLPVYDAASPPLAAHSPRSIPPWNFATERQ